MWYNRNNRPERGVPMSNEQQRHDMSDTVWNLLEPHLPGQRGQWGGIAQDNRRLSCAMPPHCPRCPGRCGSSRFHTVSLMSWRCCSLLIGTPLSGLLFLLYHITRVNTI